MQAAKACCTPEGDATPISGFGASQRNSRSHRKPLDTQFQSHDEALFMSGVFSTALPAGETTEPGGAGRRLPLYAADRELDRNNSGDCTKHRAATGALSPGLMVCAPLKTVTRSDWLPVHTLHSTVAFSVTGTCSYRIAISSCFTVALGSQMLTINAYTCLQG
jgi:hypothetical protein